MRTDPQIQELLSDISYIGDAVQYMHVSHFVHGTSATPDSLLA